MDLSTAGKVFLQKTPAYHACIMTMPSYNTSNKKNLSHFGRHERLTYMRSESSKTIFKRFIIVILFGIAFGYIEAAAVVYLRTIFYPDGFIFPLTNFGTGALWERLLLAEIGREIATLVLILTGCWLSGQNRPQRIAFFMTIFAVWDIFYYVWLKALINWPSSVMDWDILFLIPVAWASAVLAPVLVSLMLLLFSVVMLYRDCRNRPLRITVIDWLGFVIAGLIIVGSFCWAGLHIAEPDFGSYFSWPIFLLGYILAAVLFFRSALKA